MRGRLEPKDTVERFWGLKVIGFPHLSDETPKPSHALPLHVPLLLVVLLLLLWIVEACGWAALWGTLSALFVLRPLFAFCAI